MPQDTQKTSPLLRPPTTLVGLLTALAVLVPTAAAIGALLCVATAPEHLSGLWTGLQAIGILIAGGIGGCLLWAGAWLVRRGHDSAAIQRRLLSLLDGSEPRRGSDAAGAQEPPLGVTLQRLAEQVAEVNANVLLTPEQREIKRRRRQENLAQDLAAAAGRAIEQKDFAHAEQVLRQLIDEVPDNTEHAALDQRLRNARTDAEAQAVQDELLRVEDLMAVGAFQEAEKLTRELLDRAPDSDEAKALLERVRHEAEVFAAEQRRRLYGEVERHAEARRWSEALSTATRLLETYPSCPEAEAVVTELPTLRENARIEEVRSLRDQIVDLLERRRYAEALVISEEIVRRFPDTQAAKQLRDQFDRLKDLARSSNDSRP